MSGNYVQNSTQVVYSTDTKQLDMPVKTKPQVDSKPLHAIQVRHLAKNTSDRAIFSFGVLILLVQTQQQTKPKPAQCWL